MRKLSAQKAAPGQRKLRRGLFVSRISQFHEHGGGAVDQQQGHGQVHRPGVLSEKALKRGPEQGPAAGSGKADQGQQHREARHGRDAVV